MCGVNTCAIWSAATLLVLSLLSNTADMALLRANISATYGVRQVQVGQRLRDLVLVGVSLSHQDTACHNSRSMAQSVERLLLAGYRYFELVVFERDAQFFWSEHSRRLTAANTTPMWNEDITPTLLTVDYFAKQCPSEIITIHLQFQLTAPAAVRLMSTIFASIGSRLVPETVAFQSTVNEILRIDRNVVVIVPDLSLLLSSELRSVADYFVDDDIVRSEIDVNALNVVDRGGSLLQQHRSVQTLSVLVLNWHQVDVSSTSRQLFDICHPLRSLTSLLTLTLVAVGSYKAAGRLPWQLCRRSVVKLYGGLVTVSTLVTLLLVLHTLPTSVQHTNTVQLVNESCLAAVDAARHWITRPWRYRLNVFVVDHRKYCCGCACPSTATFGLGGLSALANAGRIRRQVSLTHAGSPMSHAVGLRGIFACPSVLFAYVVTSRDEGHVVAWDQLSDGDIISFVEGEFPMDATVAVYVATVWNRWLQVYATNVQHLVESGRDLYVRGSETRSGVGLAYISHERRLTAYSCRGPLPATATQLLNVTRWDDASHRSPTPTNGLHVTGNSSRHVTTAQSLPARLAVIVSVVVATCRRVTGMLYM